MQALLENLKALGQGRLIALGVTGVVLVLATFFGIRAVMAPNYSTLYRDLTPSEASRMVSALEGAGFADALEDLLDEMNMPLDHAIELRVRDEVLVDRIVNRAKEAAAAGKPVRADDNEDSLKIRLMEYYKKTAPLLGYYHAKKKLKRVDGLAEMSVVAASIKAILDN